jgi:hypothetical protein
VAVLDRSLSLPFLLFVPRPHMHASEFDLFNGISRYSRLPAIDPYHSHPQVRLRRARNNRNTPPRRVNKKGYTQTAPNPLSTHLKTLPLQSLQSPPQGSREYGFIQTPVRALQSYVVLSSELGGLYRKEEVDDSLPSIVLHTTTNTYQYNTSDTKQWVSPLPSHRYAWCMDT